MKILTDLKSKSDEAFDAFVTACKPHYVDGQWGAYRAIELNQKVPSNVIKCMDKYHAALHAFYRSRDGERGFLGSRGL